MDGDLGADNMPMDMALIRWRKHRLSSEAHKGKELDIIELGGRVTWSWWYRFEPWNWADLARRTWNWKVK